jgi:hypothetical protein
VPAFLEGLFSWLRASLERLLGPAPRPETVAPDTAAEARVAQVLAWARALLKTNDRFRRVFGEAALAEDARTHDGLSRALVRACFEPSQTLAEPACNFCMDLMCVPSCSVARVCVCVWRACARLGA